MKILYDRFQKRHPETEYYLAEFEQIIDEARREFLDITKRTIQHFKSQYGGPSSIEAVHSYEKQLKEEWFEEWFGDTD